MAEMIDVFDGNYTKIGVLERDVAHTQGLWHQTFHCWIVGERNDYRFVVLQHRSAAKKNYPNLLDITAAGHLEAGENPLDGIRELKEELGVSINPSHLKRLGIKHDISDEPGGVRNREFAHVFLLHDNRELDAYTLQEDEVAGLVEVEINNGLALFSGEVESIQCNATQVENGQLKTFSRLVSKSDLIPRVDNYYLKIFIMAKLMFEGAPHLSI